MDQPTNDRVEPGFVCPCPSVLFKSGHFDAKVYLALDRGLSALSITGGDPWVDGYCTALGVVTSISVSEKERGTQTQTIPSVSKDYPSGSAAIWPVGSVGGGQGVES